jgi:hypothetical protein
MFFCSTVYANDAIVFANLDLVGVGEIWRKKFWSKKNPVLPPMVFGGNLDFCVVAWVRGWLKI